MKKQIPEALISKIENGKCILFLGAGASYSSNGPLGFELAQYICDYIVETSDYYDHDLAYYAEELLDNGLISRRELEDGIRKRLKTLEPSEGYEKLTNYRWRAIFTTNYDDLLEKAYSGNRYDSCKVVNDFNKYEKLLPNEVPLYYLHGYINEKKPLILSYSDIEKNKVENQDMMDRLEFGLIDTVLFIGYGFNDGLVDSILQSLETKSEWNNVSNKYAVVLKENSKDSKKFKAKNIVPIVSNFDDFFKELYSRSESTINRRLKLLKQQLTIELKDKIIEFEPRDRVKFDSYFEFYDSSKIGSSYFDPNSFYRGRKPSWKEISSNLDIPRNFNLCDVSEGKTWEGDNDSVISLIKDIAFSDNCKLKRIKLSGPVASGKSTTLQRLCYELTNESVFSIILRENVDYIELGILKRIPEINSNEPYVIFIDRASVNGNIVKQIYKKILDEGLNVIVVLVTADQSWNLMIDSRRDIAVTRFDYNIEIIEKLSKDQVRQLFNNLEKHNLLSYSNNAELSDLERKINKSKHLLAGLIELIEDTRFEDSIISEYEAPESLKTKSCYGLVSLINRLDLTFPWRLLRETLNELYGMTWTEFVNEVVQRDAKGVIIESGQEDDLYYTCRHGVIANIVYKAHFKKNEEEIHQAFEAIINCVKAGTHEEKFLGRLLHMLGKIDDSDLSDSAKINLLDQAINRVDNPYFLLHIKGQMLLDNGDVDEALKCFNINIGNNQNLEHSYHSAGIAYMKKANDVPSTTAYHYTYLEKSKTSFESGLRINSENRYFISSLIDIARIFVTNSYEKGKIESLLCRMEQLSNLSIELSNEEKASNRERIEEIRIQMIEESTN